MSKPAIEVKNLSKIYNIGHELKSSAGTVTLRDAITNVVRKPAELITGHKLKKEKFWALKDINFEIQNGDVVGIIGRNGSGKSTLLKVMSRIVEPTQGEIIMRGKTASLLEVGTGFHPELTGRENIYFNGSILGMKKKEIKAKFDEIVAFSEVEKFLDTPVKFYSSGMYVRLAFAVAAHLEPDILIVDEVLAVGDAAFQKKCLGKMRDVAGQGRTVLFVSHNMASVQSLCNKGVYLKEGKIKKTGDILGVTHAYMGGSIGNNGVFILAKAKRDGEQEISSERITLGDGVNSSPSFEYDADIHVSIKCKKQVKVTNKLRIDFNIFNEKGEWIVCASGTPRVNKDTISFIVDKPGLYRGQYTVNISILEGSRLQDFIPDCVSFNIENSEEMIPGVNGVIKAQVS